MTKQKWIKRLRGRLGYSQNEKYSGQIICMIQREILFMVALKSLGYSMNTTNKEQLQKAYSWLEKQRDTQ